jgi:hypothetical protein
MVSFLAAVARFLSVPQLRLMSPVIAKVRIQCQLPPSKWYADNRFTGTKDLATTENPPSLFDRAYRQIPARYIEAGGCSRL